MAGIDSGASAQPALRRATTAARDLLQQLLMPAGVCFNGDKPWDLQVFDDRLYQRVIRHSTLGLGEAYMDGWFECEKLDCFFERVLRIHADQFIYNNRRLLLKLLLSRHMNMQTFARAWQVGKKHYDLGNDLFKQMLDSTMSYSCGYWKNAQTLEQAQINKLDLICRKLELKPGMKLLDIGCGWGGLSAYAAEHYQVSVVGVTISEQQCRYAQDRYQHLDVSFRLEDYRSLNETFDRVASVGMFEHVGHKNYRTFMEVASRCLKPGGLMLLHSISSNCSRYSCDPWISRYIFPNGMIPSVAQMTSAADGLLVAEDLHNFGTDYDKTLMAWHHNFVRNYGLLRDHYDERFYRMWTYYLLCCAGAFRARDLHLTQLVFSRDRHTPYIAVR
ncbi:cyclopropane fatty acyl phospholipid synthase [Endozoicomonadaceae bacterium StTr2]